MKKTRAKWLRPCSNICILRQSFRFKSCLRGWIFSPQIKVLTRSLAILEAMPSNSMNLDEYAGVNPDKINSFFFGTSSSLLEIKDIIDSEPHLASYSTLVCRDLWNWQQHALFSIFLTENDFNHPRYWIKTEYESGQQNQQFNFDWGALLGSSPHFTTITVPAKASTDHNLGVPPFHGELFVLSGTNHFLGRLIEKLWALAPLQPGQITGPLPAILRASSRHRVRTSAARMGTKQTKTAVLWKK